MNSSKIGHFKQIFSKVRDMIQQNEIELNNYCWLHFGDMFSLIYFIILFLSLADGQLSCYTCDPTNCEKYTKQTCPSGADYCLTASGE